MTASGVDFDFGISYYNTAFTYQLLREWDEARLARGQMPVLDMETKNYQHGGPDSFMAWPDIIAGAHDDEIATWATSLNSYDTEMWFAFDQEPGVRWERGRIPDTWTPAQYVAAYRHIVSIMKPLAPKLKFAFWVSGSSVHYSITDAVYPGDDVVDLIGWDPYVSSFESPAQTPEQCWGSFIDWLGTRSWGAGKPLGLFETGFDSRHGVAAAVNFWEATPQAFRDLGLSWVALFNSNSGPNTDAVIEDPAVWAAYGDAMRAIQAGT